MLLGALLAGCSTRSPVIPFVTEDAGLDGASDAEAGIPDAPSGGFELDGFPGGFEDGFSLPPPFATFFPFLGSETTREPPGMYDPASEEHFSYAMLWWLTGRPRLDTASLRDALTIYYTGLCGAGTVTLDEPLAPAANDAGAGLLRRGTLSVARCLELDLSPVTLEVETFACPSHDAVVTAISPAPAPSAVRGELERIRASFRCF